MDMERYVKACNYPGVLDEAAVEAHLQEYLSALGIRRRIVRIRKGWKLDQYPSLDRYVDEVIRWPPSIYGLQARLAAADRAAQTSLIAQNALATFAARAAQTTRAARAAQTARDVRDAQIVLVALDAAAPIATFAAPDALDAYAPDALDFRDRRQRFAEWCVQTYGWWIWRFELSWMSTTYLGARQLEEQRLGNFEVLTWSRPLFEAFVHGAWLLHWTYDVLYWVAKPTMHKDATGPRRLHNANGAALESDVKDLYFWHGVRVPEFVVVSPQYITLRHIDTETNVEVRRIMIQRYGQERYIQDSDARLVHADEFGELYRKERPGDSPIEMVKVRNSTPEVDGSYKYYWLRVQPGNKTAHEAIASTWRKSAKDHTRLFGKAKDYRPVIET